MSTPQEYWDACLIRSWRNFKSLGEASHMFKSIHGTWPNEVEPKLLRIPNAGLPFTIGVRYFAASFLPKINDFLCDKPIERDVELLRALQKSKLDTLDKAIRTQSDRDITNTRNKMSRDRVRMSGNTISWSIRNHDTDWNVNKGSVKRSRA